MKKPIAVIGLILVGVFAIPSPSQAVTIESLELRMMQARETFSEFTVIPERSIPPEIIQKAKVIFIFPSTVKAGFLFALKYGRGVVLVKDVSGKWSTPAFVRISGGSFGFQIGAHWTDLILISKRESAVDALLRNRFSIGGNLSVAFGPYGRHSEINTDWKFQSTLLAYSRTRGLFAAMATDGTVIAFDQEANEAYYGPDISSNDILYKSKVEITPESEVLMDTIQRYGSRRGSFFK